MFVLTCSPKRFTILSVIYGVQISKKARSQILKVPIHIRIKLFTWVEGVEKDGLEKMKQVPGFHDEPLKGERKGQRSIRLSRAYRAIYRININNFVEFVNIEEVSKHDY